MENYRIVEAIHEADAVEFGEFELSSGMTSSYYIDKYKFQTKPGPLKDIASAIAERVTTQKIAGVALGAVPLVAAVSIIAEIPYVIVRKEEKDYATTNRIEGKLKENEEIVVVEDVTTTGNSALQAVKALREFGATVDHAIVVVDRQQGADELLNSHDVTLDSLVTSDDLLNNDL